MQEWTRTIEINVPLQEVFEFTTNPKKTHLWIEGMQEERSSEFPATLGTVYQNTSDGDSWDEYEVVELKENELFTLAKKESPYRVKYTYRILSNTVTELTYHEWVKEGELENPFSEKYLETLKSLIEQEHSVREVFLEARNIPYRIPLTFEERNDACVGKHFIIKDRLEQLGYKVRWAECIFDWKDLDVPSEILNIDHAKPDYHVWLEVFMYGAWQTIDATWDPDLAPHLPVNEWSDFGNMRPAVPVIEMIPYDKVELTREPPEEYREQLERERPFLHAINEWIESIRRAN